MLGSLIQAPVAPFRARGNALINAQAFDRQKEADELARQTRAFLAQQQGLPDGVDPFSVRKDQAAQSGLDTEGLNRTIARTDLDNRQADRARAEREAADYIRQFVGPDRIYDVDNPVFQAEANSGFSPDVANRVRALFGGIEGRDYKEGREDQMADEGHTRAMQLQRMGAEQQRVSNRANNDQILGRSLMLADKTSELQSLRDMEQFERQQSQDKSTAQFVESVLGLPSESIPGSAVPSATNSAVLMEALRQFMQQEKEAQMEQEAIDFAIQDAINLQNAKDAESSSTSVFQKIGTATTAPIEYALEKFGLIPPTE